MSVDDKAGQVVTVFRSRLCPGAVEEYESVAEQMVTLARAMPGFVDYKTFAADDGERVTIVTFASWADHDAWGAHPDHRHAQSLGRERLYQTFSIQVSTLVRETRFDR